ncbi:hypothetical protein HMPREF0663_12229 [Hoylesella oralis ATCC 33269]|uniref:Uncharacterized protein n=1 Tax=Hoylesella oralis ATCC 33269 TaxID=873533 RepID=E7RSG1_9BACT|nr:hypothetical protein HMPREF0663_12229 [Hoylesella oralis ATCC 33269]
MYFVSDKHNLYFRYIHFILAPNIAFIRNKNKLHCIFYTK